MCSSPFLGGVATLVASYLARARGSGEPEVSAARAKDLDQFIRECKAFVTDNGYLTTGEVDAKIFYYRERLEELLGNIKGSAGRSVDCLHPYSSSLLTLACPGTCWQASRPRRFSAVHVSVLFDIIYGLYTLSLFFFEGYSKVFVPHAIAHRDSPFFVHSPFNPLPLIVRNLHLFCCTGNVLPFIIHYDCVYPYIPGLPFFRFVIPLF